MDIGGWGMRIMCFGDDLRLEGCEVDEEDAERAIIDMHWLFHGEGRRKG